MTKGLWRNLRHAERESTGDMSTVREISDPMIACKRHYIFEALLLFRRKSESVRGGERRRLNTF